MEAAEALRALGVDADRGLDEAEAKARLHRYGKNLLKFTRPRHVLAILVDQFKSVVILLLGAAAIVSMAFADFVEGWAILAVIAINTAIGFVTEWKAVRSMEALRQLGRVETVVRRGGRIRRVAAEALVPGDILMFEGGDVITADLRVIEASKLQANEASLTGESMPVSKRTGPIPAETPLMERSNCLFKGTSITRGSGVGLVVATGLDTELGRLSRLVTGAESQQTPLQERLDMLGRRLVGVMLVIAVLIAAAVRIAGHETVMAIKISIALAVAAIPEGLPIVATIALARGMWRMARRNALIVRLSAVETLGATGIILTDKTGTLTESRMTVSRIDLPDGALTVSGTGLELHGDFTPDGAGPDRELPSTLDDLLTAVALCNNASLRRDSSGRASVVGDPTETALLIAAAKRNLHRDELLQSMPELREEPFDPDAKAMATYNRAEEGIRVSAKGAPEAILPACIAMRTAGGDRELDDDLRQSILQRAVEIGAQGFRILAVATRRASGIDDQPFAQLIYLGMVGILDPPRAGIREAIERCRGAGIRVVMVTGDHVATARNIAVNLGLVEAEPPPGSVLDARHLFPHGCREPLVDFVGARAIARASPEQKLDLIHAYQLRGNVVAMTGDGVNDAPALKKADIGIAMGVRGTEVAREAADMVLQDDNFATIVEAVFHGRTIYQNIRKFVVYLFSCNISEILIVSLATIAGAPLPLLPLQILFLNLVTDVFPALALGVSRGSADVMARKPRPKDEPILTRRLWSLIAVHGLVMSITVLVAMAVAFYGLKFERAALVTVTFATLALAQLWHVFNMRASRSHWLRNEITGNPWIWAAIALCLALVAGAIYLPGLREVLQLVDPGPAGWTLIVGMSVVPLLLGRVAEKLSRAVDRQLPGAEGSPLR
jgi:Ca2+-transporting ATPase